MLSGLAAFGVSKDAFTPCGRRSFAEPAHHHVTRRRESHEHSLLRGDMQQALLQERRARGDVIDTRPSQPAPARTTPRDMRAPLRLDGIPGGQEATLGMQLRQGILVHPKAVSLELPWMRALPPCVQSVRGPTHRPSPAREV